MSTTEVGVETFSLTLKSRLRMEKEQMSTPEPDMALKIPPMKPVPRRTRLCQIPKLGMESKVFLLCCLQKRDKTGWSFRDKVGKN